MDDRPSNSQFKKYHAIEVNQKIGHRLAHPKERLKAFIVDLILPFIIFFPLLFLSLNIHETFIVIIFGYPIFNLILFTRGMTIGKLLVGIRVVKDDGTHANFFTMFLRELLAKPLSIWCFFLGVLWINSDPNKQAWHDKLLDTYVINK